MDHERHVFRYGNGLLILGLGLGALLLGFCADARLWPLFSLTLFTLFYFLFREILSIKNRRIEVEGDVFDEYNLQGEKVRSFRSSDITHLVVAGNTTYHLRSSEGKTNLAAYTNQKALKELILTANPNIEVQEITGS